MTVANTAGVVGKHAFTIYGRGDRTVIVDSDVLSDGADTVALWNGERGRYYHARCNMRGAVDFVCPRGWCYVTDCTFYETKTSAAMWHDGGKNQDQKFVLERCTFRRRAGLVAGPTPPRWGVLLSRLHVFEDDDRSAPYRVIYPLDGGQPTPADVARNRELDKDNIWGERNYFYNCHHDGGDYAWMADNLSTAAGNPRPADIDAKWTFGGTWDPEAYVWAARRRHAT